MKEVVLEYWDFEGGDEKAVFEFKYDDQNRLCYVTEKRYYDDQLDADNVYRYAYDRDELVILGDMYESRYDEMTHFSVKYTYRFENGLMVYELWEQTWGDYSTETKRVAKAFLNEDDANQFAESLEMAQQLLQNTNSLRIKIEKQL